MASRAKKKLKIIVLVDEDLIPPKRIDTLTRKEIQPFENEYDVITTLNQMGHHVKIVGVRDDVGVIRRSVEEFKPHIVFNLLVEFRGNSLYEPYVVSYLELLKQPYTGCNPRGMIFSQDKALTKKILTYHRIPVPAFVVFPMNRKIRIPAGLKFPLMVKSLTEDGSIAISQASVVYDEQTLTERVEFIHRQTASQAIAEEYIEGREIYLAVMGNRRLQTFTPWELLIANLPDRAPYIATSKIKWDHEYQKKVGLSTRPAELSAELKKKIAHLSKRIYRILHLSGYARIDYRLTADDQIYLLEANPNPDISYGEDFAEAAEHSGMSYGRVLNKIISLGLSYGSTL